MNKEKSKIKIHPNFQKVFSEFKDHHSNFRLINVFEICIPLWQCKQNIIVENILELDRFSKIILQSIQAGLKKHSQICDFLGIAENSFVISQFHFLLKYGFLSEKLIAGNVEYAIELEGILFLNGKTKEKELETIRFEYFYSEFLKDFTDIKLPIDGTKVSAGKKAGFSGYQILQTDNLSIDLIKIPHKNKPNINKTEFAEFFNKQFPTTTFYDSEDSESKPRKRSICFIALEYEDKTGVKIYDVRHSKKTVLKFTEHALEDLLTKKVSDYFRKTPLSI